MSLESRRHSVHRLAAAAMAWTTPRAAFVVLCLLIPGVARAQRDDSRTLPWQGVARAYVVHLPSAAVAAPEPLVVALAGVTADLDSMRRWLPIDPVAERNGFIVVYPQAIDYKWSYWHGGGLLVPGGTAEIDDVGFIAAVVDTLVRERLADPARVFVTGISRGALMAWTLACARADLFAAAAPLSSAMTAWQVAHCQPARPMTIIAVDGTEDPVQPYDGFLFDAPVPRLISVPETMAYWWQRNGCARETATALEHRPRDITRISRFDWTQSASGNVVRLYRVDRGGHPPPTLSQIDPPNPRNFGLRSGQMETAETLWREFAAVAPLKP